MTDYRKIFARDFKAKLALERKFRPVLRRYFRSIASVAAQRYVHSQSIGKNESDELRQILSDHYKLVASKFAFSLRNQLESKGLIDDLLAGTILDFILRRSAKQTDIIFATTQEELDQVIQSINAQRAAGKLQTLEEQQRFLDREFNAANRARVMTIAETETGPVAEVVKRLEYETMREVNQTVREIAKKRWTAVLDNVTRDAHAAADGQVVEANETYTVGGESLMHPGDMSHGASLGNIINCRCSSIYVV